MTEPERSTDLDSLYRELYPSLVRFSQGIVGSRPDAEDAVHDAFVAAARSEPAKDARPWLFRVTRNASIDLLRRRRTTVEIDQVHGSPAAGAAGLEPHASAEMQEKLALMRAALDSLPERGRTALLLRELAGLPYPEIGQVLDTSEGNVKVLIFRARASLHEFTEAAELECTSVRTALSAAADGEAGRLIRARAKLHSTHCKRCRDFNRSISSQSAAIGALIPMIGAPHTLGVVGSSAVSGGVAGAKMAGAKIAAGAALAAATIGVSAGGVAVWTSIHPHHPPQREAAGQRPTWPAAVTTTTARDDQHELSASGAETAVGDDDGTSSVQPAVIRSAAPSSASAEGEMADAALWTTTPVTPAVSTTPPPQESTPTTSSDGTGRTPVSTERGDSGSEQRDN